MAKNSADYWRDREAAQRKKDIVDQLAYNREIRRIYQSTLDNVQKEIDAFYGKYAKKEGITLAEAKRRVSRLDMEAYERKAKRYVKERDFSPQANEEMRLYNLTMKVNRLEMLKANIGLELIRGFDDLNKTFDEKLTRHATGEFERLAGILGDSVRNNSELAHAIVNASFHNATYSDRIWAYQDLLRDEIGKQVQTGLLQGRNSMELARAVQKRFDVSRSDAERLMMTEMRRVRTEVAKQSYEQNGNTEYQFLALGGNPCNDCADLDGRVFPVKEMMPGTNAPPMHPRCLCSTAPYWDEAKFQEWLDGPAQDGVSFEEFENRQMHLKDNVRDGVRMHFDRTETIDAQIAMYRKKGYTHRKIGEGGGRVIEKALYQKLVNRARKHGADIRLATDEVLKRLEKENANAVTYGDTIFFKKEPTVSDVLEETYHFFQNKRGLNDQYPAFQRKIMNEIDAKEYLISVEKKYKIPSEEMEVTRSQLAECRSLMERMIEDGDWVEQN